MLRGVAPRVVERREVWRGVGKPLFFFWKGLGEAEEHGKLATMCPCQHIGVLPYFGLGFLVCQPILYFSLCVSMYHCPDMIAFVLNFCCEYVSFSPRSLPKHHAS